MNVAPLATNHFCLFEVDFELFAASAEQIREIISKPDYAKVPTTCPLLAGLWHEGSEFLPVLRLPFQRSPKSERRQALVINGTHGNWALLVDSVFNVAKMGYSPNNDPGQTELSAVTLGMSTWEGRAVRVLQLERLYRLAEQVLKRETTQHVHLKSEAMSLGTSI